MRIPRVPAATGDSTEEFFQVQEYVTVDFDGFVLFCVLFFFLAERLPSPRLRGFPPAAFHVYRNIDDDETRIDWPYPSRISAKPKVSRKNCSVYGRSSLLFPSPQQHADVALEGGTPHQKKNPRKPWEKKESLQVEF